jgi:hypothetical protein
VPKYDKIAKITKQTRDKQMVEFLEGVTGVVEATSAEKHWIWREFSDWSEDEHMDRTWKQGSGLLATVGTVGKRPVCISVLVDVVNGKRILFYHATSQVVDHQMVEEWLKRELPVTAFEGGDPRKRMNHTDATNWSNVILRGE